jgi:hypothetical protein
VRHKDDVGQITSACHQTETEATVKELRAEVEIEPSGASGRTFRPTLLAVEPERELRWLGHLFVPGVFDGEHIFTIEQLADRRVRFVQSEVFRGILVPLLSRSLDRDTLRGFGEMNTALKTRAEQG